MKYDMDLLIELNKEWEAHPFQTAFPVYSYEEQIKSCEMRMKQLASMIPLEGKRILEIGGGKGYTSYVIAKNHPDAEVTCIDIYTPDEWDKLKLPNLEFMQVDLSQSNPFEAEQFDLIISYVAWEHMRHPFEVLQQAARVLKNEGLFYLYANLYRGPSASHLYRIIYFPYPHLLFDESIVKEYAIQHGADPGFVSSFYDVNKLTYAEYKEYFNLLKMEILKEEFTLYQVDEDFYERVSDKLSLYPFFDLERDYFKVLLKKKEAVEIYHRMIVPRPKVNETNLLSVGTDIHVDNCIKEEGCEYAWYVITEGEITDRLWYPQKSVLTYKLKKPGKTVIRSYVRRGNEVKYNDSYPFTVLANE